VCDFAKQTLELTGMVYIWRDIAKYTKVPTVNKPKTLYQLVRSTGWAKSALLNGRNHFDLGR